MAGILELKQRGKRGVETLPPTLRVRVQVGHGSVDVVRRFIDDPGFDADVEADLLNRLYGARRDALPVRHYEVEAAGKNRVAVEPAADDAVAWFEIEGGDRHGRWFAFKATAAVCRLGRGTWHGDDELLANDLVLSDADRFVSRRAAILHRAGSGLEVESRDQGEYLVVVRRDGKRIRPTHVRRRRVRLHPGDALELSDGGEQILRLKIHRRGPDTRLTSEDGSEP